MTFLLTSDGRERDVVSAFRRYREYLKSQRSAFPPSAYALATSDWYFDPQDHRCPHDAWLERARGRFWPTLLLFVSIQRSRSSTANAARGIPAAEMGHERHRTRSADRVSWSPQ